MAGDRNADSRWISATLSGSGSPNLELVATEPGSLGELAAARVQHLVEQERCHPETADGQDDDARLQLASCGGVGDLYRVAPDPADANLGIPIVTSLISGDSGYVRGRVHSMNDPVRAAETNALSWAKSVREGQPRRRWRLGIDLDIRMHLQ